MMLMRTAKSCGSDAPIVGVKPVRRSAGDGVKKRGHRGEREVNRKTIARGMPGRSGVTAVTNSYAFFIAYEAAGALGTRHSLRPLFSERRNDFCKPRAHHAAGRRTCDWRHCEERKRRSNQDLVIPGRCEASNPESRDPRCAIAHLRSGAYAPS